MKENYTFYELVDIIAALRGEHGCPWDKEQTHESLKKYLLEEAYESVDAIDSGEPMKLADELGDVLLQILLHSAIGAEKGEFSVNDVINCLSVKMITRHPHVFADTVVNNSDEVLKNWEQIKRAEKKHKTVAETLEDIPIHYPALMRAEKIVSKLYKNGITDFSAEDAAVSLRKASDISENETSDAKQLIGQLLLTVSVLAHTLKVSPEICLSETLNKTVSDFAAAEEAGDLTGFSEKLL